jgi:hypothetical protein
VLRAQDIPAVAGRDDHQLLGYATSENRVVVTHDFSTMVPAMLEVLHRAGRCAHIVLVPENLPVTTAVEDLLLLNDCSVQEDWGAGVLYLPLR